MPASPRSIATFIQQFALVCLWDLWLIHFRKFCIFHQVSTDSQAYQHLPARDPASHWQAIIIYQYLPFHWDHLRSIEPEIGASNYQANLSKQGASRFDPHSTRSLQTWRLGSDHFQSHKVRVSDDSVAQQLLAQKQWFVFLWFRFIYVSCVMMCYVFLATSAASGHASTVRLSWPTYSIHVPNFLYIHTCQ